MPVERLFRQLAEEMQGDRYERKVFDNNWVVTPDETIGRISLFLCQFDVCKNPNGTKMMN
jgi:hypothetical protein